MEIIDQLRELVEKHREEAKKYPLGSRESVTHLEVALQIHEIIGQDIDRRIGHMKSRLPKWEK